jgi:hypothetical protein
MPISSAVLPAIIAAIHNLRRVLANKKSDGDAYYAAGERFLKLLNPDGCHLRTAQEWGGFDGSFHWKVEAILHQLRNIIREPFWLHEGPSGTRIKLSRLIAEGLPILKMNDELVREHKSQHITPSV